jgi:hypothetical protein
MTTINQDEYMKDRKGRLVPISQISDYDLAMDSFVREQVAAAKAKRDELSEFKAVPLTNAMPGLTLWQKNMAERAAAQRVM